MSKLVRNLPILETTVVLWPGQNRKPMASLTSPRLLFIIQGSVGAEL